MDEAGRGPLVGPVTAAAVVFKATYRGQNLRDSKKLSAKKRLALSKEIEENSLCYSIVSVGPRRIEKLNILGATKLAMRLCAERICKTLGFREGDPNLHFLVDGNFSFGGKYSQEAIIKGDEKIAEISAASIMAKVKRDELMKKLDSLHLGYGFAKHKGYPTREHLNAIETLGPCGAHRRSFRGVRRL